jgi:hypothetical protein
VDKIEDAVLLVETGNQVVRDVARADDSEVNHRRPTAARWGRREARFRCHWVVVAARSIPGATSTGQHPIVPPSPTFGGLTGNVVQRRDEGAKLVTPSRASSPIWPSTQPDPDRFRQTGINHPHLCTRACDALRACSSTLAETSVATGEGDVRIDDAQVWKLATRVRKTDLHQP